MSKIKVVPMSKLTGSEPDSEPKSVKKSNPPKKIKVSEPQPSTSAEAMSDQNPIKKKPSKKPAGLDLILEGIKSTNDRKGATLDAIKKFVISGKENLSEQQVRMANTRTLKVIKQAVEDGILVAKGKQRYGFTDKGRSAANAEKKKAEKAEKKAEKESLKKEKAKAKAKDAGKKKKKQPEEKKKGSEEKKKPLIKGSKARKSLAKVAEMNKKRRSTVVVLPKKTTKKTAAKDKK
ncbi:hypothetical protein ACFFRR_003801 [Megaselia abdita]